MLEKQCKLLQDRIDEFNKELSIARTFVSQGVTKTQAISSALHRCEYARTRTDLVDRVRSVLQGLRNGTVNRLTGSDAKLDILEGQLVPLRKNTNRVIGILGKA
jgi:hypothetical protein